MKFRRGIFVVIYKVDKNKKISYLLLKRHLHWKGWEFSKGGIEKNETEKQTVKREVKEESGLKHIKIRKYLLKGRYNYDKKTKQDRKFCGQTYRLYSAQINDGKVKIDKREHSDYKWASFEKAMNMLEWKNQKQALKIVNRTLAKVY